MRAASTLTSSRHPATFGLFGASAVAGAWGLFVPRGVSSVVGQAIGAGSWFEIGYYLGLFLAGLAGLAALSVRDQDVRLRAERCAWYGVGWFALFYGAAALIFVGVSAGQAAVASGMWSVVATWRILQITVQRRRHGAAVEANHPSDPPTVGESREANGRA